MGANTALLKRNVARIRRQIRLASREMQQLIDGDHDCSGAAKVLVHLQAELKNNLEKLEQVDGRARLAG